MATAVYRQDGSDQEKAKLYNRRLHIANERHKEFSDDAKEWWKRYENLPKRSQNTPKGHLINVPTGSSTIDALFANGNLGGARITGRRPGTHGTPHT